MACPPGGCRHRCLFVSGVGFFLFLFVTAALLTARQAPPYLESNTLLRITLSGEIIEYSTLPEVPVLRRREVTQTDILEALQGAAKDVRIEGLLVDLDNPQMGWGKAFELHQALLEFRESGKPTCRASRPCWSSH